ncbi:calcium-binding protein [Mesorhizobium sp. M2E.F.Ca.ET.209.01.1.1]|uniref:calcium-binding protein n=1 Tax=Mesorhizobium sp. M2E.F.Ca.ET.209.01.1.1 TaxID=2500526 RepID=UPI000FD8FC0D|nr:calcium-binding protein [Mesorhizobium sp. M2E.F.Ca.ET.209.01.1.1]RWL48470.1 MAG: calcium-binding protein [Mesorhizobium sp.]TGS10529.1 calcium-binding protein [Mesorhizobium sp. M2E.F.Ca.ET.209.01.1.1]
MATLHYASGGSATEVATAGFNLVDVQYLSQVNALPDGMKGLVYLSAHDGVTQSFIDKVTPFLNNPKVFGFFLMDEPDPTGRWGTYASAANLKAESDWIHSHFPGAKTFITMMNMGSSTNPDFTNTYNPANTGIDYYGLDPYPVRTGTTTVDYNMIDRAVAAAVKSGIPIDKVIPVYQTFGGGGWETDTGGKHVMPTTSQMQTMMDHWAKLVPSPAFDYAYAWGSQNGDTALENSPELQALFRQHNASSTSSTPPVTTDPTPPTTQPTPPTTDPTPPTTVDSSSGDHVVHGGKGNNTYHISNAHDKVMEANGGGFDKVMASVSYALSTGSHIEQLSTSSTRGKAAIDLTGNEFGQTITGNNGDNKINGGGGSDLLKGYGGHDAFVFNTALGPNNIDRIADFNVLRDKIYLDHAIFAGLQQGALAAGSFHVGHGAHDASDHIIYNSSTGTLSFDSDGVGGHVQTQFASLAPHLHLGESSFFVT